jgi:2-amino-4-deoxychorismate synthase
MIDLTKPFAVIQKEDANLVLILQGPVHRLDSLSQIPRKTGKDAAGRRYDTLSLVPFSQIREKGFEVRQGDESLLCMAIESQREITLEDVLFKLPEADIVLDGEPTFDENESGYQATVAAVIEKEIGEGQGANFVISRICRARLKSWSPAVGLSLFKRLVRRDYGTYWKYVFFDGIRMFIGSTPEKHLSVDKGRVMMNPISGTFRKQADQSVADLRGDLLKFLRDPKEINELFMVVDEELKMMSKMCERGGLIVGPLLKEMSRLVHSEYLLVGQSGRDVVDLLRESMFAATVTGSPVENACHIIARYEPLPRRYYAGSIALIGRDEDGEDFLDSPILIRSFEVDPEGEVLLRVGATLVRDSRPADEVAETRSKSAAMLGALTNAADTSQPRVLDHVHKDALVVERLFERNQNLSTFWFLKQEQRKCQGPLKGVRFACIDNEDDFLAMFGHLLEHLGATVSITPWKTFDLAAVGDAIVVPGPGPGNPGHDLDPKMALNGMVIDQLLREKRPFLAVCLGHQILCHRLGLRIGKKKELTQGVQKRIDYYGRPEDVGFYNTFAGFVDQTRQDLEYSADPDTGEIHALRGTHFSSFQFHPESILTRNGCAIVEEAARRVVRC